MAKATAPVTPPRESAPRDKGAIVLEAVERMRAGDSIREIAQSTGIGYSTLHGWLADSLDADQYARAREAQADAHVDRALAVAEDASRGALDPQGARLLVDTLKWRAARFHRSRYGDQAKIEHAGEVGLTVRYEREGRR